MARIRWALDTVATVGSIPEPDDAPGQAIKVALIVLGVGTLFYALVTVTEVLRRTATSGTFWPSAARAE